VKRRLAANQADSDYSRELTIQAPPDRLFDAVATLDGLRGWWTPRASGTESLGGEIRLAFEGLDEHIDLQVIAWRRPVEVEWRVVEHTALEDWNGTTIRFLLSARGPKSCSVAFRHLGLSPALSCYDACEAGWEHFLGSLATFVERGQGRPFRAPRG
jgi:uncharacterized protein YndB with AHSA1/START domain